MKKEVLETEVVIVGSGTGGATLAKELSKKGKKVILVEKGKREKNVGRMKDGLRFYEGYSFRKSIEGTILYGTSMVGGTSVVASGNALLCLEKEFLEFGIDLKPYAKEAINEIKAVLLPDNCISPNMMSILEAAEKLGLNPKRIPKFIDPNKCIRCGNCVLGCRYGAKWSAINFIDQALENRVTLLTQTSVKKIIINNGRAMGIEAVWPNGPLRITAQIVILCAGGINTPRILQNSGIESVGQRMFCDPFVTVYGLMKKSSHVQGINTPFCIKKPERFILFPIIDPPVQFRMYNKLKFLFRRHKTIGIMIKIADDDIGEIIKNGNLIKHITIQDKQKFKEGIELTTSILTKAGAYHKSISVIKQIRGAHIGGTVAIGEALDSNLQIKEVDKLYVCDNSVFPTSTGNPPILTIISLGKWLAGQLNL